MRTSLFLAGNLNKLSDFVFVFSSMAGWMLNLSDTGIGGLLAVKGAGVALDRARTLTRESFFFLKACRLEGSFKVSASKMIDEEVFLLFYR